MNNEEKNTYMIIQMTAALFDPMKKKPAFEKFISDLQKKPRSDASPFSETIIVRKTSRNRSRRVGIRFEAAPSSGHEGLFPSLFDFYRENREFYTILYREGMFSIMMETIIDTIRITPDIPNLEAYMKSFWAYVIYGWL